ncbi:lysine N(6)-hydroxylase/L-ornithine N(5)-oxygenase family protein [Halogeometricum sp. S1BR25-6]|uniref:Lysine N(6)-hydroxylase/L-ornithine N(5)-oxygenase family protein n=1 Tax=Halogeometricum salsisoli TaxID=2950536 RepID=A0ABU2GI55_9EURY|nr:lysine N(6)-hydroxylase/L-ornithine N(5)-oxygenase family protein [Halogeometricum sp. S1BR25-6]MDS0300464.1 lysine N(6)-hydroxylase/L-ornithine N(5)-oxygenase family protein [Halogeometricum sp. S1BR25-6]
MTAEDDGAGSERTETRDVVGVGVGPFNLGLAALLEGSDADVDAVFLERDAEFHWHEGMLLDGTTLEVPFLADLVTLADPTNPYSYLNYLRETGRIYEFYFYETFQIPRREYDDYLRWVVDEFDACRFSREVTDVRWDGEREEYVVVARHAETGERFEYRGENVALGVGSRPQIPEQLRGHSGEDVFHTARYRHNRERALSAESITVVGSGQSAAEVFYDLLKRQSEHGYRLDWLTRSDGFFPMEYSKLGLQHFTPEYERYVYDLPQAVKDDLIPNQDLLYKGVDPETSADIYDLLYRRSIGDREPDVGLFAMTEARDIEPVGDAYALDCRQWQTDESFVHESEVVVCGTGYERPTPGFLEPLEEEISWDERGRFEVTEDHRLEIDLPGEVFLQNAELHTHGVGVPDLGLGCYRNTKFVNRLAGREVYPEDVDTVYQDFSLDRFVEHAPGASRTESEPTAATRDD